MQKEDREDLTQRVMVITVFVAQLASAIVPLTFNFKQKKKEMRMRTMMKRKMIDKHF